MTRLTFALPIHAPTDTVYRTMLGLPDPATYAAWTAVFNPTSTFRGDWSLNSKMLFIGVDEHGHTGGMISRITQHDPARLVSIQHYGLVQNDDEITTGPDVEKWANGFEIYTFDPTPDGHTLLTVHLDTAPDFVGFMEETYPKALQRLKELCEA